MHPDDWLPAKPRRLNHDRWQWKDVSFIPDLRDRLESTVRRVDGVISTLIGNTDEQVASAEPRQIVRERADGSAENVPVTDLTLELQGGPFEGSEVVLEVVATGHEPTMPDQGLPGTRVRLLVAGRAKVTGKSLGTCSRTTPTWVAFLAWPLPPRSRSR